MTSTMSYSSAASTAALVGVAGAYMSLSKDMEDMKKRIQDMEKVVSAVSKKSAITETEVSRISSKVQSVSDASGIAAIAERRITAPDASMADRVAALEAIIANNKSSKTV